MAFRTALVGVSNSQTSGSVICDPSSEQGLGGLMRKVLGTELYCTELYSWTWKSTHDDTTGSETPRDVTVTGINGMKVTTSP